ncbi:MAG: WG repeat-containing protein [Bacteroidales bacterium]|nr:WG repeat-containing protein [Bacteroidales bacterium]
MKNLLKSVFAAALLLLMVACNGSKTNEAYPFPMKYLPVQLEGSKMWSILDLESGEVVAKDAYKTTPSAVVNDMYFVMNDEGTYDYYNVADPKKPVNKEHFGSATEFSVEGLALASLKGKPISIINDKCEVVKELSDSVAECSMFNRGLAVARFINSKYGYIDTEGKTVIPAKYDQANAFMYEDHTTVMTQRENDSIVDISFIDKKGTETFKTNSTMYHPVTPSFNKGVLPVVDASKPDTVVCLDVEGKDAPNPFEVPEAVKKDGYNHHSATGKGTFVVVKGDKLGVVDQQGGVLIPVKYFDIIDVCPNRYLISEKQGVYFLADENGKPVGKAKIAHANGTPNSVATRGFIDLAITGTNLMSMFNENGFVPVAKGATVGSMLQAIDAAHPEAYVDHDALAVNSTLISFAGPIASKGADGQVTFNVGTPVRLVGFDFPVVSYADGTEDDLVQFMAANMGKNGFVSVGGNVFESENGTAVALGYKSGIVRINYYMDKADAQPLPAESRKGAKPAKK